MNFLCLALQYSFTSEFYYKYCEWIECCWKAIFMRKTYRSLQKQYERNLSRSQKESVTQDERKQEAAGSSAAENNPQNTTTVNV